MIQVLAVFMSRPLPKMVDSPVGFHTHVARSIVDLKI